MNFLLVLFLKSINNNLCSKSLYIINEYSLTEATFTIDNEEMVYLLV